MGFASGFVGVQQILQQLHRVLSGVLKGFFMSFHGSLCRVSDYLLSILQPQSNAGEGLNPNFQEAMKRPCSD